MTKLFCILVIIVSGFVSFGFAQFEKTGAVDAGDMAGAVGAPVSLAAQDPIACASNEYAVMGCPDGCDAGCICEAWCSTVVVPVCDECIPCAVPGPACPNIIAVPDCKGFVVGDVFSLVAAGTEYEYASFNWYVDETTGDAAVTVEGGVPIDDVLLPPASSYAQVHVLDGPGTVRIKYFAQYPSCGDDGCEGTITLEIGDPLIANDDDADDDDLSYQGELCAGTNPLFFDSDGDCLGDGHELTLNYGLWLNYDPTRSDTNGDGICDGDEDVDSDGLSNCWEVIYGTQLDVPDSDGGGRDDGYEVRPDGPPGKGGTTEVVSFPSDPQDDFNQPATEDLIPVRLVVGDPSESHSEIWALEVTGESESIRWRSAGENCSGGGGYGEMVWHDFMLRPASRYEIRLQHLGSLQDSPDYDYAAYVIIDPEDGTLYNSSGLLGPELNPVEPYDQDERQDVTISVVEGLVAILTTRGYVAPSTCPADITGPMPLVPDGTVDAMDYIMLMSEWGSPCTGPCHADLSGPVANVPDGNVDAIDYLALVDAWGPCSVAAVDICDSEYVPGPDDPKPYLYCDESYREDLGAAVMQMQPALCEALTVLGQPQRCALITSAIYVDVSDPLPAPGMIMRVRLSDVDGGPDLHLRLDPPPTLASWPPLELEDVSLVGRLVSPNEPEGSGLQWTLIDFLSSLVDISSGVFDNADQVALGMEWLKNINTVYGVINGVVSITNPCTYCHFLQELHLIMDAPQGVEGMGFCSLSGNIILNIIQSVDFGLIGRLTHMNRYQFYLQIPLYCTVVTELVPRQPWETMLQIALNALPFCNQCGG